MDDLFDRYQGSGSLDLFDRYTPKEVAATPEAMKQGSAAQARPPDAGEQKPDRSWTDVPGEALRSLPESAGHLLTSMAQPFLHPVDTAKALVGLADAVGSKISRPGDLLRVGDAEPTAAELAERAKREAPADAVRDYFVARYGTEDGWKEAIAKDPIGVLADVSTVLTGGGAAVARAPGVVGKAGEVVSRAGALIDPLTQAGNAVKYGAKAAEVPISHALGMTTGAGAESVRTAGRAGREGGETAATFTANMRGDVPVSDIVSQARSAVDQMRQERSNAYKAGMADISKDATVLDFQPIEDALAKAAEVGTFKGVTVNRTAAKTMEEISDIVREWKALDPAEFHTPEGLDALKRTIGDLRDATEHGTPSRVAADRIYNAVKGEIQKQAPGYAKVMEDYATATEGLKEATRTFSLGEKATGDTAARKLLSVTRNNVQTNYAERTRMLDALAEHEPTLPAAIAGQALNAAAPRGLVGRGGGMLTAGSIMANPLNALALPAFSPRIVGETVYFGGKAVGGIEDVAQAFGITAEAVRAAGQATYQAGRTADIAERVLGAGSIDQAIAAATESMNEPPSDVAMADEIGDEPGLGENVIEARGETATPAAVTAAEENRPVAAETAQPPLTGAETLPVPLEEKPGSAPEVVQPTETQLQREQRVIRLMAERRQTQERAAETGRQIDEARERTNTEPTDGQKEAGNYAKGRVTFHGIPFVMENPEGSVRRGVDADGKPWEAKLPADYGYLARTKGADGDQVDAYIGPNTASQRVWVVDQIDPKTGKFDEHKVMLGMRSVTEARTMYHRAFSDGTGPQRIGAITEMSMDQFKAWLHDSDTRKPVASALRESARSPQ